LKKNFSVVEKAELQQSLEIDLQEIIHNAHKAGLSYIEILELFSHQVNILFIQSEAEEYLKLGGK